MNINKLKENQIIKNYKELCELLEIKVEAGNSKKSQLKELDRHCKYHKEGNKFIIDEIYKDQLPSCDMRMLGNNSAYGEELRNLILYILATSEDIVSHKEGNQLTIPCTLLLRKLHMVNCNYSLGRREQKRLSELMCMDECYINEFYNTTHSNLKNNLETALKQLRSMALISWSVVEMVCKKKAVYEMNELNEIVLDDNLNPLFKAREVYLEATPEEVAIILSIERNLLTEYKCDNIIDLYKIGKVSEFYKRVNSEVRNKTNILYYFNGYQIIFNKKDVIDKLNELGENIDSLKEIVNNAVKQKTLENAVKRNEKSLEEYYLTDTIKKNKHRISDDYMSNIELLIIILIDMKAKNIRNELKVEQLN